MGAKVWLAAGAALIGTAVSAAALAQPAGPFTFSVRNDTDETLECGVKKAGSGVSELLTLRPGREWKQDYAKAKPRNFRCEGAAPIWYTIHAGRRYRLAENRDGLIVLSPAGPPAR